MEIGEIQAQIETYQSAGWKIEALGSVDDGYIITPEGDVFYYYDLMYNICPICSQLEDAESAWCNVSSHGERLEKRIKEAEELAKLIDEKARLELSKKLFGE